MSEIENRLFINGEFVPSKSGKKFDVINPATEKVSASVYEADEQDVDLAVKAAKAAQPAWADRDAADRAMFLLKLADLLEKHNGELARLEAISMGKPVSSNLEGYVGARILRTFAGGGFENHGETSLNTKGMMNFVLRQPYGVTAAIIAWNVPITLFCFKLGPCLMAGNTLILKSSEKAPLTSIYMAKLMKEAGFPEGVVNVLSGFGIPCGQALASHMEIRKISFTGSARTGREIKKAAANSNLKNVTLELGGKSPLVVFEDADLAKAVPAAAFSILYNSGQICVASSRIYVQKSIAEPFIQAVTDVMQKIGANPESGNDPLSPTTVRGPQADKIQFDTVMKFLDDSRAAGHKHLIGGGRDGTTGYYIQPTVIYEPGDDSDVVKKEIFGPVVVVNTFETEEEVLRRANDTEYGLYASVFTRDIGRALRMAKGMEAGTVGVNCTSPTMALDMPFGGYKSSGEGREMSKHAFEGWLETKTVLVKLDD